MLHAYAPCNCGIWPDALMWAAVDLQFLQYGRIGVRGPAAQHAGAVLGTILLPGKDTGAFRQDVPLWIFWLHVAKSRL